MKLVITDAKTLTHGDIDLSVFSKYGDLSIYSLTSYENTVEQVADADMVLCNKTLFDENILSKLPNLKYIGLFATGYNNIDTRYCREHGIVVSNAASYSTEAVVQQVFGYIFNHYCRIAQYNDFVQNNGWIESETFSPFVYKTEEISGKTLGIVGYGSIGKRVSAVAQALGMRVIVNTRTPSNTNDVEFVSFDELLLQSDIISVHCPLTDKTKELFDEFSFAKCARKPYFINTSRGPVVNEIALRHSIENGTLSGAAVDVLAYEPMRNDCPILGIDNITITPHVAWAPLETRNRLINIVKSNIEAFFAGSPKNTVQDK